MAKKSYKQSLQKRAEEASITFTVNGKVYDLGSRFLVTEGNDLKTKTAKVVVLDDGTIFVSIPFKSNYLTGLSSDGTRQGNLTITEETSLSQIQQDGFDQWIKAHPLDKSASDEVRNLNNKLAEKDAQLAEKDAEIARLRAGQQGS